MTIPLMRRRAAPGWHTDPIKVFQWMQTWNFLLCRAKLTGEAKAALVLGRSKGLRIPTETLQQAVALFVLNRHAEELFFAQEQRPRRGPSWVSND